MTPTSGIDNVLDRLFRKGTLDRLAEAEAAEQFETRPQGLPQMPPVTQPPPVGTQSTVPFSARFPLAGQIGRLITSPMADKQNAVENIKNFVLEPMNPLKSSNWVMPTWQGERRFLGYSTRPEFDLTIGLLPKLSGGWRVDSKEQVANRAEDGYITGYYLKDPNGNRWTLSIGEYGQVYLDNMTYKPVAKFISSSQPHITKTTAQPSPPQPPPPVGTLPQPQQFPSRGAGGEILSAEMFEEQPPPPPSPVEMGLRWANIPFTTPGALKKEIEETKLYRFDPNLGVTVLKSPQEIAEIVNQPAMDVVDWLPGGRKFEEYYKLPLGEQMKAEAPLWIASFFIPGSTALKLNMIPLRDAGGILGGLAKALSGKPGQAAYKTLTGEVIFEPFKFAAKGIGKLFPKAAGKVKTPVLQKVADMWKPSGGGAAPSLRSKLGDVTRKFEELATDKFAGINKLTARARQITGGKLPVEVDAELHAALLAGAPEAGVQKSIDAYKQMVKVIGRDVDESFVDAYLHLRHNIDVLNMHPQRKIAGGLGADELQKGLDELRQTLGDSMFAKVEQGAAVIRDHYRKLLQAKVQSGLVAPDLADQLIGQYPWYNPIKYIEDVEKLSGGMGKSISVTASGLRRLSELGSEAARDRPLNSLVRATIEAETLIRKNNAAKAILSLAQGDSQLASLIKRVSAVRKVAVEEGKDIFRRPPGEIRGTISLMENGKRIVYEVPSWLEKEMKYLATLPNTPLEQIGQAINAVSRFGLTTANLAFFIPNFAVDSLTAVLTQGVGPARLGKRLLLNLKGIVKEDKLLATLRREGGGMSGFWGKTPEQIAAEAAKKGQLILHPKWDAKRVLGLPFEAITKIGHAVEMAPRTAVLEKLLGEGELMERAILASRRATIDFSRGGYAVRQANALYLYLNAGVQGAMIPFRALRDSPRSRLFIAGLMGSAVANYGWNRQFPEYADIPDYVKYGSYPIMLPSEEYDQRGNKVPHYITVIPNMREWALFTAPITYALRKLDEKAPDDLGQFLEAWLPGINPVSQITESGIGVPTQLGSTIAELSLNKDLFRDRDIVPDDMKNLPPEEQYSNFTSETAKKTGEYLGMSPMKLDFFIKNVFGGLGQQFVSVIDAVIRKVSPDEPDTRLAELFEQLQAIKPPEVTPEDVNVKRNEFLFGLQAEDREALLDMERRPEEKIPVITPIANRLYRDYGGQLYKTGQAAAEKETGISAEQTANASKILGKVSAELQKGQEVIDNAVRNGQLTMPEWRENHQDQSKLYQGALMAAGLMYPGAGQSQDPDAYAAYLDSLYTLASTMQDRRTRGQLLVAAWRSLAPEQISPGKYDFDTFWAQRDEFRKNLLPEDKALLDAELKSRMTAIEKVYFDGQMDERLSMYYKLPEGKPREMFRQENPEFDVVMNIMGLVTTVRTEKALDALISKAEMLGIPNESLPAFAAIEKKLSSPASSGRKKNYKLAK